MSTPTPINTQIHNGPIVWEKGVQRLIQCQACGFIHVDLLPTQTDLKAIYDAQFYSVDKPDYLLKDRAEQDYWRACVYQPRYQRLNHLLNEAGIATRRILDIGCSGGFFLAYGQENGWEAVGIEPAEQAAQFARQQCSIEVIQDYFQNIDFTAFTPPFDVIHLRQVLEHLPDPVALCHAVSQALRPGGILCIEVPNDFNFLQALANDTLKTGEYWVSIPHHLNYFTPASLEGILSRLGYSVIDREASFPMELFLLMGDYYVGNDPLGRACHQKRMHLEQTLNATPQGQHFRDALYRFFAEQNVGRTIALYTQKLGP